MKVGDHVCVVVQELGGENYAWVPDLLNKTGVITQVSGGVYSVKMDQPFRVKRPPEGMGMGFGYDPPESEKQDEDEWYFVEEEIEVTAD